jgi:hypothetical protein
MLRVMAAAAAVEAESMLSRLADLSKSMDRPQMTPNLRWAVLGSNRRPPACKAPSWILEELLKSAAVQGIRELDQELSGRICGDMRRFNPFRALLGPSAQTRRRGYGLVRRPQAPAPARPRWWPPAPAP